MRAERGRMARCTWRTWAGKERGRFLGLGRQWRPARRSRACGRAERVCARCCLVCHCVLALACLSAPALACPSVLEHALSLHLSSDSSSHVFNLPSKHDHGTAIDNVSRPGVHAEREARRQTVVLILVGLIGSGKSTFAHAVEQHVPRFRRCNQDDLGSRQRVEASARACLREGLSVCIDRTNFDARQRATWINMAREFSGTEAWVLVFDTPYAICEQRLRERTDHPTIKTPQEALRILARFHSDYQAPAAHEGHTRLLSLPAPGQLPVYTREDVLSILDRVREAPPPPEPQTRLDAYFPPPAPSTRGGSDRGRGGYRGWRGGGHGGSPRAARRGTYLPYDRPRDAGADQRQLTSQSYGRGSTSSGSWRRSEGESSGQGR